MREEQKPVPGLADLEAAANAILARRNVDEIIALAGIASRVQVQAAFQAVTMQAEARAERPDDREIFTIAEAVKAFKVSSWAIREAVRQKRIRPIKPHPNAVRGFKVSRGEMMRVFGPQA